MIGAWIFGTLVVLALFVAAGMAQVALNAWKYERGASRWLLSGVALTLAQLLAGGALAAVWVILTNA